MKLVQPIVCAVIARFQCAEPDAVPDKVLNIPRCSLEVSDRLAPSGGADPGSFCKLIARPLAESPVSSCKGVASQQFRLAIATGLGASKANGTAAARCS